MATLRQGEYGSYYGSVEGESEPLTDAQMQVNALYIYNYLTALGWTINSISAMLGNMQAESTINSGRWQNEDIGNTSVGYSLVQWTPASKYIGWCNANGFSDPSEMDSALSRIVFEVANNEQWIATDDYNMSFEEFTHSDESISVLASAFLLNYERPADQSVTVQQYRTLLATEWYAFLSENAGSSTGTSNKKRGYNFILFNRRKRVTNG